MSTKANVFENGVIAALDTCANRRAARAGSEDGGSAPGEIGRTVAIIESAAAKLDAGDFSAIESVLAGQALALDRSSTGSCGARHAATSCSMAPCTWRCARNRNAA